MKNHQTWVLYIPKGARKNFQIALKKNVWGAIEKHRLENIAKDDIIVFVYDLLGSGRITQSEFKENHGLASQIIISKCLTDIYNDNKQIWPDKIYPYRFQFQIIERYTDARIEDYFNDNDIDSIRLATITPGKAYQIQEVLLALPREKNMILEDKNKLFLDLFQEFTDNYLNSKQGIIHHSTYRDMRINGQKNFDLAVEKIKKGEEYSNFVLEKLFPYGNNKPSREKGYWIHIAPAIRGNMKAWFENAKWVDPKDWDKVTKDIVQFIQNCVSNPEDLKKYCDEFSEKPYIKGIQSGMLSPILNAMLPQKFLLFNYKTQTTLNFFKDSEFTTKLSDYPEANRALIDLVEEYSPLLEKAITEKDILKSDVFDMFSHWFVAIKKYIDINEGELQNETSYWIFQANPKYYDLKGALKVLDELVFTAHSHKKEMKIGDKVFFWTAGSSAGIIGLGSLKSLPQMMASPKAERKFDVQPGRFDGERIRVKIKVDEVLNVPLLRTDIRKKVNLQNLSILRNAQGTNFPVTKEEASALLELIGQKPKHTDGDLPPYQPNDITLEGMADSINIEKAKIENWVTSIRRKKQSIIYGPPGTGKTYLARFLARYIASSNGGIVDIVQFHPSYAYEDFIQGIRPKIIDEKISYEMCDGRFIDFCKDATGKGDSVLVIDEINRANLSKVFGELMYLLEYRNDKVPLAGGGEFKIPDNVFIVGTMNTADRSIALVDFALRRRFNFIKLVPDYDVLKKWHKKNQTGFDCSKLIEVLKDLNRAIGDENYSLGITFFFEQNLRSVIQSIWEMEIEPYMEEYFFDFPEKVNEYRWSKVGEKILKNE